MKTKNCKRKIDRKAIELFGVSQSYLNTRFKAEKNRIEYEFWVRSNLDKVEAFEREVEIIASDFKACSVFTKGNCDGGYKIFIMVRF